MTSGVRLAGFSTLVRYLRVLNPILFDFIVPAVTTGPTFAFKRSAAATAVETVILQQISGGVSGLIQFPFYNSNTAAKFLGVAHPFFFLQISCLVPEFN